MHQPPCTVWRIERLPDLSPAGDTQFMLHRNGVAIDRLTCDMTPAGYERVDATCRQYQSNLRESGLTIRGLRELHVACDPEAYRTPLRIAS